MKKIKFWGFAFLFWGSYCFACDACDLQQPKITRGFTHGLGPDSNWDWLIVGCITLITLVTLFYSIKFLLNPGERNKKHIKANILKF